jgi:hypothetical protein
VAEQEVRAIVGGNVQRLFAAELGREITRR